MDIQNEIYVVTCCANLEVWILDNLSSKHSVQYLTVHRSQIDRQNALTVNAVDSVQKNTMGKENFIIDGVLLYGGFQLWQ